MSDSSWSSRAAPMAAEMFGGGIDGRLRDPLGKVWWIQQRAAELTPEEMEQRAAQPEFIEAMRYVQSAQLVEPAR